MANIEDKIINVAMGLAVSGAILIGGIKGADAFGDYFTKTVNSYKGALNSNKIESIKQDSTIILNFYQGYFSNIPNKNLEVVKEKKYCSANDFIERYVRKK